MGLLDFFKGKKKPKTTTNNQNKDFATTNKTVVKNDEVIATLVLNGTTHKLKVPDGDTILSAALDEGLDAPYMCEAGVCSTCRALLEEGEVEMMVCHALSEEEVKAGYVLSCQCLPKTKTVRLNYDV